MKKAAAVILLFLFASWLYCTLFLDIDFETEGYAELVLRPFNFIKDTSNKVKGIYDGLQSTSSWWDKLFGGN